MLAVGATTTFAAPSKSGTIRDESGSVKYRYSTDSSGKTTYRDNSGSRKFTIDKSGTVRDNSGSRRYTISSNGTVRDSSGRTQGRFSASGGNTTFRDSSVSVKYRIIKEALSVTRPAP